MRERAVVHARIAARRRRDACGDPVVQRDAKRPHVRRPRIRVAGLLADAARRGRDARLRCVLRVADRVDAHVGRKRDVGRRHAITGAVSRDQRHRLQIRLVAAVGVHDLRARAVREAAIQDAVNRVGKRIGAHLVREREHHLGAQVPLVAAACRIGVAEAIVGCDKVRSGNVRAQAVEHDLPAFVGVETPIHKALEITPTLGIATPKRPLDPVAHGVLRRSITLKERDQVARRGEAERKHDRILRGIHELERRALIVRREERVRTIDPYRQIVDVRPHTRRHGYSVHEWSADELRVIVHDHVRLALVKRVGGKRQREIGARGVVEDLLGDRPGDDRAAVRIARDRQRCGESVRARSDEGRVLPAGPHDRVAAPHEETGAGAGCVGVGDARRRRRLVERGVRALVAAIHDIVEDFPAALAGIDGLEDEHVGRVLDHPPGVARRKLNVRHERIAR